MAGISSVRIELARNGLSEVLRGPEVQKVLNDKAQAVQAAARGLGLRVEGDGGQEIPLPVEVEPSPGSTRARAVVVTRHPSGLAMEAKHRVLGSALGAARNA